MSQPENRFIIQAYTKSEMHREYEVSAKTFRNWLLPVISQIGNYRGKRYTPDQVAKIVAFLGTPKKYI